ncbi:hypothetical protein, partial [Mesorhizobium sp. Cs1321R2N1]|uniref:hypothetical protein n=1 Tax=Mesorhizobium sp. Cs1321R2N1 TaxID=3015174 RepID=UPI00301C2EF9
LRPKSAKRRKGAAPKPRKASKATKMAALNPHNTPPAILRNRPSRGEIGSFDFSASSSAVKIGEAIATSDLPP